jgi:HSP20 family protein
MTMRDLIPWGRQNTPARYQGEENNPILDLHRNVNRLFDDVFRDGFRGFGLGRSLAAWPSVEVQENDNEFRISAEVPGLKEEDIDLFVEDGVLTLRGERRSETQDKDRGYSERYYGRFERRIALPSNVDEQSANATFRDGVLTVTLARTAQAQRGRKIPINAATRH